MAATHHELAASPATCHWGSFDARLAPVLSIEAGDRVTVHTVSGAPDVLPGPGFAVPPEHALIHDRLRPEPGPHILTGPIRSKAPGAATCWRSASSRSRCGRTGATTRCDRCWARCPRISTSAAHAHPLDRRARSASCPGALELPLAPFFGVMGVAPPAELGPAQHDRAARASAATSTTRSSSPARRSTCRSCRRARCSPPATATPHRATARSA